MLYNGRIVRKPKYEIGDVVKVKDLAYYVGKIGFIAGHRGNQYGGWHYKVHGPQGQYLTWSEKSLVKVPVRRK